MVRQVHNHNHCDKNGAPPLLVWNSRERTNNLFWKKFTNWKTSSGIRGKTTRLEIGSNQEEKTMMRTLLILPLWYLQCKKGWTSLAVDNLTPAGYFCQFKDACNNKLGALINLSKISKALFCKK